MEPLSRSRILGRVLVLVILIGLAGGALFALKKWENKRDGGNAPEEITLQEEKKMIIESGCIWGCDICQNVCPLNKGAGKTDIAEFRETAVPRAESDTEIEGRAFAWRGEKVIKRNIDLQEDR